MKALYGIPGQPRIDTALDKSIKTTREVNNRMLVHVIRALVLLTRQNLATRGKTISKQDKDDLCEPNSNLIQVGFPSIILYLIQNCSLDRISWYLDKNVIFTGYLLVLTFSYSSAMHSTNQKY